MSNRHWYKRDPDAAIVGMEGLTLEEIGAYNMVLDLIYSREGDVRDDDRYIAAFLRVDIRVWRRIRGRLLEQGKLCPQDGKLHNRRADVELDAAQHRALLASEASRTRWQKIRIINGGAYRSGMPSKR